jgi:hypothetical protein
LANTDNNPQDQNIEPGSDFQDPALPNKAETGHSPSLPTPLPDFDILPIEKPVKISNASSQNLNDFLTIQRSGDPQEPQNPVSEPVYKISPAEPDLSNYTMPALDEPLPEKDSPSAWQATWSIVREVGETVILTLIIFFVIHHSELPRRWNEHGQQFTERPVLDY